MKKLLMAVAALFIMAGTAQADLIAWTSFEEPAGDLTYYKDAQNGSSDHALVNYDGRMPVNYTSTGGELGFSSHYYGFL